MCLATRSHVQKKGRGHGALCAIQYLGVGASRAAPGEMAGGRRTKKVCALPLVHMKGFPSCGRVWCCSCRVFV